MFSIYKQLINSILMGNTNILRKDYPDRKYREKGIHKEW